MGKKHTILNNKKKGWGSYINYNMHKFDFRAKNITRNKECHFIIGVNLLKENNKFKHLYT